MRSRERRPAPPRRATLALAAVASGFVLAELFVVTPDAFLSWDEALYVSQFSTGVPAMDMDAHRSAGMPLLVAPLAAATTSVTAIRVYLSVLAGVGVFLAYLPWIRCSPPGAVLAALLFASLAVTLTNGNVALPNLFVALAVVAAAGCLLRAVRDEGRRQPDLPARSARHPEPAKRSAARRAARPALVGLAAAFAVLSLVRPTDAVWATLALLAAPLVVPSWRRRAAWPVAAVGTGLAVGGAVWLAEASIRYGGPLTRLAMVREITGAGMNFVLLDQIAQLGRSFAADPWQAGLLAASLQWSVLLALLAYGLTTARGTPQMPAWTLATGTALVVSGPYLLLLPYPSARYLLPGAALLALPVAGGMHRALTARRHAAKPRRARATGALAVGVAVLLAAHVAGQLWAARTVDSDAPESRFAAGLRELGVRPPCYVSGSFAPQIAYAARCSARDNAYAARRMSVEIGSWRERHPETVPALTAGDRAVARAGGQRLVVVGRSEARPSHLAGWSRVKLLDDRSWYAYFPPDGPDDRAER